MAADRRGRRPLRRRWGRRSGRKGSLSVVLKPAALTRRVWRRPVCRRSRRWSSGARPGRRDTVSSGCRHRSELPLDCLALQMDACTQRGERSPRVIAASENHTEELLRVCTQVH